MRFAKIVFTTAGVWGFVVLTPLFFIFDWIGQQYPPPVTHPDFYYGFITVALAWQVAFLLIGRDPVRFRPFMIAAMLEKFGYIAALTILAARGQLLAAQAAAAGVPDGILGLLFVAAFVRTGTERFQPVGAH